LKFEHLVEINDPADPGITPLSRAQLWRGLRLRAEDPRRFVYGLDACLVAERGPDYLVRRLRFGKKIVSDRVDFTGAESVRYAVAASEDYAASSLTMQIEEPAPGRLFLRFVYASDGPGSEASFEDVVKQAYYEADLDTVARIRQLAAEGRLD
jgi:hypothetical protein